MNRPPSPFTMLLSRHTRRREFITLARRCGGRVAARGARAAAGACGVIGFLMGQAADDPVAQIRNAAFLQGLQELGWTVGRNTQIEYRWAAGDATACADTRPNW